MRKTRIGFAIVFLLFMALLFPLHAQEEDVEGSRDHPFLSRMPNFYITDYKEKEFDRVEFKNAEGEDIYIEGRTFSIDYELKEDYPSPSELQILRNIENAVRRVGGTLVFEDPPSEAWLTFEKGGKTLWVYVFAHCSGGCYDLVVVEKEAMVQEVTADPEALANDIASTGHASVYGIYFDVDSDAIKPESEPSLRAIADMLKADSDLKVYIVGHTDMTGTLEHNMELSLLRAKSVVKALVEKHGISAGRLQAKGVGPLCPVSTNRTEAGRKLNRRVELVEMR